MKSKNFNHSLLAVGVAAVMGLSTGAIAGEQSTAGSASITNVASATYSVGGQEQKKVDSNPVVISITETVKFSLVATNIDGDNDVNTNKGIAVIPNGTITYNHTLTNGGNFTDSYDMDLGSVDATQLANITVTYQTRNTAGDLVTVTNQSGADFANAIIILKAGDVSSIVISEKTSGNKGGSTTDLTLSATSDYLSKDKVTGNEKITNNDDSITRLPVFSIVKRVTNSLDLNNINDTAEYTITVKNDGSATYAADAKNIKIVDILPAGLKLATANGSTLQPITVTNSTSGDSVGTTTTTSTSSSVPNGFTIDGANLKVGSTITIVFKVQRIDATTVLAASTVNHVRVEDLLDDTANTTNTSKVIDSTNASPAGTQDDPAQTTGTYYPSGSDSETLNGAVPTTVGSDYAQSLITTKRGLKIEGSATKEIPVTTNGTTRANYESVITNSGDQVEGDVSGELTFTITGDTTDTDVNIGKRANTQVRDVTVTIGTVTRDISPTTVGGNTYDIFSAFPSGIPANGTATIKYNVVSSNAIINTTNNTPSETTIVTLVPLAPGNDNSVPTEGARVVTDNTYVRGLLLSKKQVIDTNCNGTVDSGETLVNTKISAIPGQCVIYQIVAENNSSSSATPTGLGFSITDLIISDELAKFTGNAIYKDDAITTTTGGTITTTATTSGGFVTTTVNPLTPKGTATLQFSIRIKPNAATVTPN